MTTEKLVTVCPKCDGNGQVVSRHWERAGELDEYEWCGECGQGPLGPGVVATAQVVEYLSAYPQIISGEFLHVPKEYARQLKERAKEAEAERDEALRKVQKYEDHLCFDGRMLYKHHDGTVTKAIEPMRVGDLMMRAEKAEAELAELRSKMEASRV